MDEANSADNHLHRLPHLLGDGGENRVVHQAVPLSIYLLPVKGDLPMYPVAKH